MANTWTNYDGKRITMTYDQVGVDANAPEWAKQQWNVTLRHGRRRMSFPYYGGGMASDPTADDVVECIALDDYATGSTFQEWCDEFGYDSDSRRAEALYRSAAKLGARWRRFIA